mmetsp:Transcript_28821/g.41072  ORF Transcript_28821/g.41072 Transcript_28821/m.41072 type:complete len:162 (+) Transcript_28821:160-645(+)
MEKREQEISKSLNEETIIIVQNSWNNVRSCGIEKVGLEFFRNVFSADPEVLQKFKFRGEENVYESKALRAHGRMVISAIGDVITGLRDLRTLSPILKKLFQFHEHLSSGVIDNRHFILIGTQLIITLRQLLGDTFSDEVAMAWIETYAFISSKMQIGKIEE